MKKTYIKWLLFLGLALVLAAGLSYLAVNPVSEVKDSPDSQVMSIALVNEDKGAIFNSSELAFGDAFVSSVEKNNEHEWYVVSRGVAESGLENNTYDMMIVIPNDFSEKALSINSEAPEQVVLNYKINATGNEHVQGEAEKTASTVLNNFNQRIIDVYFASIIGNLQDAQDSVAQIVNNSAKHTYTYQNTIQNPLSNYTNQFETVKDNTQISKDSFSGLEDVLASFEESLTTEWDISQDYQSSVRQAAELQQANSGLAIEFYDRLRGLREGITGREVEQQLSQLDEMNQLLQTQFAQADENNASLMTGTKELNVHFKEMLDVINETEKRVNERLDPDALDQKAKETISGMMNDVFPEDETLKISILLEQPDKNVRANINNFISELPSLDGSDFEGIGLPQHTVNEIKNVIAVTKKYNQDFEYVASSGDMELISDQFNSLKRHLTTEGVSVTDTVKIPENKKAGQTFILTNLPENYQVTNLSVKLPDQKTISSSNKEIELPANKAGEFTVKATFKLDGNADSPDIFEPIKWGWKLVQEDTTDAESKIEKIEKEKQKGKSEEIASKQVSYIPQVANMSFTPVNPSEGEEEDTNSDSGNETEGQSPEEEQQEPEPTEENGQPGNEGENAESEYDQPEDESGSSDQQEDNSNGNPNDSGSGDGQTNLGQPGQNEDPESSGNEEGNDEENNGEGTEKNEEDKEVEIEIVEVINNTIQHQVMSEVTDLDKVTQDLIKNVSNTISPYQKLASLYESYFGLHLNGDISSAINQGSLQEIAGEDSLYTIFNRKDISTLLEDYVAGRAIEAVTSEVRTPLENWQAQIAAYRQLVETADDNASQLIERVAATREQAQGLNEELAKMISNASEQREQSLKMVEQQSEIMLEQQSEIQANKKEEQTAVMALSQDFQPLLMTSQSLADQASSNLYSAETVYQTFDTIDKQATAIQESGVELVGNAENLSATMTDQLINDQEFVNNFTEVLANSRIGDRPNEDLYDFLSNPVQTQSQGVISTGDTFTPYFVVLICFIVALFTAYAISTINQKRIHEDQFESERSLVGENALVTGITGGIGVLEGLIIGLVSGYFLNFSSGEFIMWTVLIVLAMASMLFIVTYLLRQLKMVGMFILLTILSMYLLLTRALGNGLASMESLRMYSPLQHVESFVANVIQGTANNIIGIVVFIGITAIGVLANLLVLHPSQGNEGEDDEQLEKAN